MPLLSVIVCTYNRASLLDYCLKSLQQQTLEPAHYEVLVVDNNSTDSTQLVVAQYPAVRYVREAAQGLSHARNRGCREAQGTYLLYLDDDAQAPPQYLARVSQNIRQHQPDLMGGPIYPYYLEVKPRWFRDKYEIREYAPSAGFSTTCNVSGSNFIIRKDLLEALGLFDVRLGMIGDQLGLGEERKVLEDYRATRPVEQQKVYYDPACHILHYVPPYKMSLCYHLKRSYRGGQSVVSLQHKTRNVKTILVTLLAPCYHLPRLLLQEWRQESLLHADYFQIARMGAFYLGRNIEIVKRLLTHNTTN